MGTETILFADNDSDFLDTRKQFLEREGYNVITAGSPKEAINIFESKRVDLAILDIRLEDDDDKEDMSGLSLAKKFGLSIPIIILTGYPSFEYVREALIRDPEGKPSAVDFIDKKEGGAALLQAARRAFDKREIFIVHGRDEASMLTVKMFLTEAGLRPIILREQPSGGQTIIEMIEGHSNVKVAIAILTPDDVGCLDVKPNDLKPRARQNVIFELGYFIGKLGRGNVIALYKKGVEIPSDYLGVRYYSLDDAGGWKLPVVGELRNLGLPLYI